MLQALVVWTTRQVSTTIHILSNQTGLLSKKCCRAVKELLNCISLKVIPMQWNSCAIIQSIQKYIVELQLLFFYLSDSAFSFILFGILKLSEERSRNDHWSK